MRNRRIRNICIGVLCIILFVYMTILVNSVMNKNKVGILSWRFYIMSSDSPESDVKTGDLVIAKSIKTQDIKEQDNIILKKDNDMIVRKIKSVGGTNGNVNFHVDTNNSNSGENIENAQIIGKVVSKISGLGNVALFIQSPLGTLNIIIIAVCIFIIIKKLSKNIQGEKDDEKCETNEKNG